MVHKTSRPAPLMGGADRAAALEFLGRSSNPENSTADLQIIAAALQRGATLFIGPRGGSVRLPDLKRLLRETFFFDDEYRRDQLIAPTALCMHWLSFTGRRCGLNHLCPVTKLRQLIVTCFGLEYSEMPTDAVLGGLVLRDFQVERVKAGPFSFNWAANVRKMTYHPQRGRTLVRITELGFRGAVPPIRISEP